MRLYIACARAEPHRPLKKTFSLIRALHALVRDYFDCHSGTHCAKKFLNIGCNGNETAGTELGRSSKRILHTHTHVQIYM
jgi:hypothetical protein